ncbi:MAG TPA: protein kinase, partial [Polyangiaceae bacterium]|nr:protein kinase [Polyangiaceae bacterium]
LVHRDVTPHNLFVTYDGNTKVVDFGIAKFSSRMSNTRAGTLKGKLAYMSPEQARGKPVDRRSDVFSAGIVLWELLSGRRLFDGDNEGALLVALLSEKPKRLEIVDPTLAPYAELVHKALETEPDARYPTALAMAEEIAKVIPCASRTEVANWVKGEARLALARREAMVSRAKSRAQQRNAAKTVMGGAAAPRPLGAPALGTPALGPLPPPASPSQRGPLPAPVAPPKSPGLPRPLSPPAPAVKPLAAGPGAPASDNTVEDLWDSSTTTQDVESPAAHLARATGFATPSSLAAPPSTATPSSGGTERPPPPTFGAPVPLAIPPMGTPPSMPALGAVHAAQSRASASSIAFAQTMPASALAAAAGLGTATPASGPVSSTAFAWQTPASSVDRPSVTGIPASARAFERPDGAEAMSSQVTMTTTEMPPPLAREQVRRLTVIAAITAAVTVVAAVAMLAIFSRKPWQNPPAPAAKSAPLIATQADKTAALVPTAVAAPAPSAPADASASAAASSGAPSATATAVPPPPSLQTAPHPTQLASPKPMTTSKSTTVSPKTTTTAKTSSTKPKR